MDIKTNYYVSDKEMRETSPETIDSLTKLMDDVNQISGIDIFLQKLSSPMQGTKVIIQKEI